MRHFELVDVGFPMRERGVLCMDVRESVTLALSVVNLLDANSPKYKTKNIVLHGDEDVHMMLLRMRFPNHCMCYS